MRSVITALVLAACGGDDGVGKLADAPSSSDGGIDGMTMIDGSVEPFTPKTTCSSKQIIVDLANNDYAFYPALLPMGAGQMLTWVHGVLGQGTNTCDALYFNGSTWGNAKTFDTDCDTPRQHPPDHFGTSATRAVVSWTPRLQDIGKRALFDGNTWTNIGSDTVQKNLTEHPEIAFGDGGGVEVWYSANGVSAATITPTGTFTPLGENTVAQASSIDAVVHADGTGYVAWQDDQTHDVIVRPFSTTAWSGMPVKLTVPGNFYNIALAPLPTGVYAVWIRDDGTGVQGAEFDGAAWGAIETLAASGIPQIAAAADGELTLISGGFGNAFFARRRIGGTWAPETMMGTSIGMDIQIDTAGHVTVAYNENTVLRHRRSAHGTSTWTDAFTVATGAEGSAERFGSGLDPTTGDPLFVWGDGNDIVFSRCH